MKSIVPASLGRELLVCAMLGGAALLAGVIVNQLRAQPLPARYVRKDARLQTQVQALKPAPTAVGDLRYVSVEELIELQARAKPVVLDARPELFYRLGHIPGALSLPREKFQMFYEEQRGVLEKDKGQTLVVYCQGESCEDSELVAKALRQLGYANVNVLLGGWTDWQARGPK